MGKICERCGKSIGFIYGLKAKRPVCKECEQVITQNIKTYESRLDELTDSLPFTDQGEDELRALAENLQLTEKDMPRSSMQINLAKRLTKYYQGQLPVIQSCDLILKKNEVCHYSAFVDLIEERRKTQYVGGSRGVSVRIVRGLSYRVGGFKGERITEEYNQITDNGTLYVTNKRVVFAGTKKNVSYPLKSIAAINKFSNAIQFKKENEAKPKYFGVNDDEVIEELSVIVTFLVQENI